MANERWIDLSRVETTVDRLCEDARILSVVLRDGFKNVDDLTIVLMGHEADVALGAMECVRDLCRAVQKRAVAKGYGDGR